MRTRRGSFEFNDLGIRGILLIVAIICFVIAAVGIDVGRIDLIALGLAFFAGAFLFER
jgi:Zn-dependent membrane protease YugP